MSISPEFRSKLKDAQKTHEFLVQNCNLEEQIEKFVDSFMRKHLNPNG